MADQAVLFAGQGAQCVGMGKDLAEAYPECKALYERADEVLGYGLSQICFEGPEEELTKSNHCQPAIFVTSVACYTAYKLGGGEVSFSAAAGLSLGEWSALHIAGALTFEDSLRVLEARGRFMQEACDERDGAMVSVIGLPAEKLVEISQAAGVGISNLNSAQQTVLSGERDRIIKAEQLAQEGGAKKTVILRVAGAYHSPLMASAAEKLGAVLDDVEIKTPGMPVLSNVTGQAHGGPEEIKENMIKQVTSSVRWLACIEWCGEQGVTGYLECGPGRVLSGLVKRIDRGATLKNIQDMDSLQKALNDT